MNLLLTGVTGFVGFNLLLAALRDPAVASIAVCVRRPGKLRGMLAAEGIVSFPAGLQVVEGDASCWNLRALCRGWHPDVCIHCAGVLFARSPADYRAGNVRGVENLLAELPASCRLVVLSSQSAAGPTPPGKTERDEADPERPLSDYGKSKLEMERVLWARSASRSLLVLRPPTVIGPHDLATLPLFRMARGFLRLKPGSRDKFLSWIAAGDLAAALLLAARQPDVQGTYFVAGGVPVTDRELIGRTGAVLGKDGILLVLPDPVLRAVTGLSSMLPAIGRSIPSLTPDRARELLEDKWVISGRRFAQVSGWKPQHNLDQTLAETAASYRRRGLL